MISALLYLQFQTLVNRQKQRLKRLKKPKYLIGGIVGVLYFYFYFFRFVFGVGKARASSFQITPEHLQLAEAAGAAVLLFIVLLAWIIPHSRAALVFTDAEVNFLFPAPISRRVLVHYKLLRSQMAILFTTLFLTLISGRFRTGGSVWIHALGWWIILSTLNLHFLGSSFARTLLLDSGITNWKRRLAIVLLLIGCLSAVAVWSRQSLQMPRFDLNDVNELKAYFRQIAVAGPVPYLLYPFRLVVRPYLAPNATQFLFAAGPALLMLLLHYLWVVRSNVAFEEASIDLSRRLADRISAARSGKMQLRPAKARRSPFPLSPVGTPAMALLWKNLIGAGQFFTARIWIILALSIIPAFLAISSSLGRGQFSTLIGMGALMVIIWSVLIGPQVLRQDFRQDIALADILKSYPLRGWQLVLGELLAPTAILTSIQWLLILMAALCVGHDPEGGTVSWAWRVAIAFSAAVILPTLNLLCLVIPNASVLLYPGWFQTGKDGAQGIEATGQRLIVMLGQIVVLALALLPGGAIFGLIYFSLAYFGHQLLGIPLASLAASVSLLGEIAIAVVLLGKVFERFDLSAES